MLLELEIQNIALIESLRVEFARGLNVLTGETGSGKSILVDCINLVLGERADREMIRTGADRGFVQALFDLSSSPAAIAAFEEAQIQTQDGLVSISRELLRSGRNVCRVCGIIVPLTTLKQLTEKMMDLHGQHQHQALLDPAQHIVFLDAFGDAGHHALCEQVAVAHAQCAETAGKLRKLTADTQERARLQDVLRFQWEEISAAKLKPGEEEKLKARLSLLENAERIHDAIDQAYRMTYQGDGNARSAQELLREAAESMAHIGSLDDRYHAIAGRLNDAWLTVQDIGYELQAMDEDVEANPALMEKIAARLDVIDRLERKYGPSLEEVIAFGKSAQEQLSELQTSDEQLEALRKKLHGEVEILHEQCDKLTESRKSIAKAMAEAVMQQLEDLGMKRTQFEVKFTQLKKPGRTGADGVEFMISPNPGEPLRPLASIASGGELSRIMLAFKVISMDKGSIDAMVFDEIDTGISGRMAQVVGEKMAAIAANHQVLCVTHLPQIAAMGDWQYLVDKVTDGVTTRTRLKKLDFDGRVDEIGRMVSGAEDTDSSRIHAAHMLEEADRIRSGIRAGMHH